MWRIYDCLVLDHDYRLVAVAAAICLFGTAATFVIAERARESAARRGLWLALTAVAGGATVWATHFVAMLAFQRGLPVSYALAPTLGSLAVGIAVIGAGFAVAVRRAGDARAALAGGLALGAGVIALHYIGMAAVRLPGRIAYDADLVVLSVAFSLAFGAAALHAAFGGGRRRHGRAAALALFVLMVVSLHFTAMGAVVIEPGPWEAAAPAVISRDALATLVTGITLVLLALGLAGALLARRRALELMAQAQRFRLLSESALEGLVIHRDGAVLDSNAAARRLLDLSDDPGAVSVHDWFRGADRAQVAHWLAQPAETPAEVELTGARGRGFTAEICGGTLQLADGTPAQVLALRDVTARKQAEARLQHQALHDPLTDLPNRRLFLELADKVRAQAERSGRSFAILMLDLDHFKAVNDMHGHEGGDRLLTELGRRLQGNVRDSDVIARFGGDEFAVVATGASQPHDSVVLAERLAERISAPVRLGDAEVMVTASIGIAVYPGDGGSIEELIRNADTAMYGAKADGRATFMFFEPRMNQALEARRTLEGRLRRAVLQGELGVAYQPLADSRTGRAVGFEALVRWHDDALGQVPPAEFIPVAEETGLIIPLGEHVLRTACRDAARWPAPLRVAVNLSAIQFRRAGLAQTVCRILEETGLPGERLDLEITESILIENRQQVLETLHALKALGVRISMDDFGTGYSSLSYLQSFPFDKIKIDRVFVANLENRPHSRSIIRAVTAMGHSLDMKVVAEGVETGAQAAELREMACDELQGYLIAKPMPAHEVTAFLAGPEFVARAP